MFYGSVSDPGTDHTDGLNSYYAIDFNHGANTTGQPVLASADGKIAYICATAAGCARPGISQLGMEVVIHHADNLQTVYAHLSAIRPGLKIGQAVWHGYEIGNAGCSGNCYGAHLHFGIWQGATSTAPAPASGVSIKPQPLDGQTPVNNGAIVSHNFFGITVFDGVKFGGAALNMRTSDNNLLNNLLAKPNQYWSDRISSVAIRAGCRAVLYENANYTGWALNLSKSVPDLRLYHMPDGRDWSDDATSIAVVCK